QVVRLTTVQHDALLHELTSIKCRLVPPWRLLIYPLRCKLQAFGERIEQTLNTTVDIGEQAAASRLDIRHRRQTPGLNFIDSRLRPLKNLIDHTHELVAQLIELGSQLHRYPLTVLATITHEISLLILAARILGITRKDD